METFLTIVSRREERDYAPIELPEEIIERILLAGRATGSSKNTQPIRYHGLRRGHASIESVSSLVTRPTNIATAAFVVVVAVLEGRKVMFDAGRACQNMMLAAWSDGVGSCPNTVTDADRLSEILNIPSDQDPVVILSFGYPASPRDVGRLSADAWSDRLDRLPLAELVRWPG